MSVRLADLKAFGARHSSELTATLQDMWMGGIVGGLRQVKTK